MSTIHVLIRRYRDGSGFYVLGATESDAVAQAFCAGGENSEPVSESYSMDTEASVCSMMQPLEPSKWE